MAGIAARNLGWRPGEFWNATPADLLLALGPAEDAQAPINRDDINRLLELDDNG